MPKARRGEILRPRQEVKKRPISEEEINTDISKSLNENIENRFRHWEKIEKETKEMEQKLEQLKKEYRECPDIPENRPKISNLRAEIRDMEEKIQRINRSKDPTEYLFCVANVIRLVVYSLYLKDSKEKLKRKSIQEVLPMGIKKKRSRLMLLVL